MSAQPCFCESEPNVGDCPCACHDQSVPRDCLSDAAVRVRTSTADRLQIAAERVGGQAWCEADEDSSW